MTFSFGFRLSVHLELTSKSGEGLVLINILRDSLDFLDTVN